MRPWQLIDTVMEVDPSDGYKNVLSRFFYSERIILNSSLREITRRRQRGRSSDCPSLSLFARSKAFWVASCTRAKHNLAGNVIGLLDGCCHGNPLYDTPFLSARPRNGLCHQQLCLQFPRLLHTGQAHFISVI